MFLETMNKIFRKVRHGVRAINRVSNLRYYFLLRDSELFDPRWYSKFPKGYLGKKLPAVHYLTSGAPRGRDPSPHFCGEKYLKLNPMVRKSGTNPLAHYLIYGKEEDLREYSRFTEPLKEMLSFLVTAQHDFPLLQQAVDIIIPVFNCMRHLPALFDSIFAHTTSPHRFIIVDDASTDPAVWPYLMDRVAGRDNCLLLRNEENLGFPGTVNRAANECTGNFIALNTDTVVPEYWLERLMRPIIENSNVASTTPFSNAAGIFSFPNARADNALLSSDIEIIDGCFRRLRPGIGPRNYAPTGSGFCIGINGDVWRRIGGLDQNAFGRGYAEETDWCQRAMMHGYRNILVQNLFVAHHQWGSFDETLRKPLALGNIKILNERWPNYLASVNDHIRNDKWSGYRRAAFLAFCLSPTSRPLVVIDAVLGGGANLYSGRLTDKALDQSRSVVSVRYHPHLRYIEASAAHRDFQIDFNMADEDEIISMIPVGRAETVLINELVSWKSPESVLGIVVKLKNAWDANIELALHDFFPICPTANLLNANGNHCYIPLVSVCRKCLPRNKYSSARGTNIDKWRDMWRNFLASVDIVSCFSHSTLELATRVYPEIASKSVVAPHEPAVTFPSGAYRIRAQNQLVIGVVGLIIVRHKGSQIVGDLARLLRKRDPQARIVVVGKLNPQPNERNIKETGEYTREDLPGILNRHRINVVLMPSIVPETFSYVTQEIISLGCPIVCFDLGGQAEQVRKYDLGRIASAVTAESALQAIKSLIAEIAQKGTGHVTADSGSLSIDSATRI